MPLKLLAFFWEFIQALARDLMGVIKLLKIKRKLRQFEKSNSSVPEVFRKLVAKQPNKPCAIFDDQIWTFQQVKFYIAVKYRKPSIILRSKFNQNSN
jgi:hypothetical protein